MTQIVPRRITQTLAAVHCRQCDYEWVAPLLLPLPVGRFVKVMRGIVANGCPACGATGTDVLCGTRTPKDKD